MGKWAERYLPGYGDECSRMHSAEEPSKPSKLSSEGFEGTQVARIQKIQGTLTAAKEQAVRRWLSHIEEVNLAIIAEVLDKCRYHPEAQTYFRRRAEEVSSPEADDRHTCRACRHLRARHCMAKQHGIDGDESLRIRPHPDLPRRCLGFEKTAHHIRE